MNTLNAFFARIAKFDGDLDEYLYDHSIDQIAEHSGVDAELVREWLIANEYIREPLEVRAAVLRAEAIAVGKQLNEAKVEGKTMRVVRGLEHAHHAAWLRYYEVDNQLHTIRGY